MMSDVLTLTGGGAGAVAKDVHNGENRAEETTYPYAMKAHDKGDLSNFSGVTKLGPKEDFTDEGNRYDAKKEIPPKRREARHSTLPPKSETLSKHRLSAGSLLMGSMEGCKDDTRHELTERITSEKHDASDSVKAFFENDEIPSFEYNMSHKHRGYFVVFNFENYASKMDLQSRRGTSKDARSLRKTARALGFAGEHIKVYGDLKKIDFMRKIRKYALEKDHTHSDCLVVVILTHGEEGDFLYVKDGQIQLDEVIEEFRADKCQTLAGKPKLFFIQACRGTQFDYGGMLDTVDAKFDQQPIEPIGNEKKTIPNAADFFIAFSTVPGHYAWRHEARGSWFIQALCKRLREDGSSLELVQIMTRVNKTVAHEYKAHDGFNVMKQMPHIVTQLTAEVIFRKKPNAVKKKFSIKKKRQKSCVGNMAVDGPSMVDFADTGGSETTSDDEECSMNESSSCED